MYIEWHYIGTKTGSVQGSYFFPRQDWIEKYKLPLSYRTQEMECGLQLSVLNSHNKIFQVLLCDEFLKCSSCHFYPLYATILLLITGLGLILVQPFSMFSLFLGY